MRKWRERVREINRERDLKGEREGERERGGRERREREESVSMRGSYAHLEMATRLLGAGW